MPAFEITAVHTEPSYANTAHEHIAAVEINASGVTLPRATVINDIRYGTDSYYTYGGGLYADVVVRGCPYCGFGDYITTTPDSTVENNLLHLPRF